MSYCPTCHPEYGAQTESCETCKTRLVDSLPQNTELVGERALFCGSQSVMPFPANDPNLQARNQCV